MDDYDRVSPCKEWQDTGDVVLKAELEHLRRHLADRDAHIINTEAELVKSQTRASEFEDQVNIWREKYERLYDSYKRVQKLNQVLEDKLLQMVDKMKNEKSQLTKDIATLSVRLAESKHSVSSLHKENERYKNDMNLAIQLLQCKPDNFVSQKLDNLSTDTQARVSQYVMSKTKSSSSNGGKSSLEDPIDVNEYEFNISASLMSKILEDSIQDTMTKHCDTCTCMKPQNNPFSYHESHYSVATQTSVSGEMKNSYCLNCNSNIDSQSDSLRNNSPLAFKVINSKIQKPPSPLYLVTTNANVNPQEKPVKENDLLNDKIKSEDKIKLQASVQRHIVNKIGEDLKEMRDNLSIEPTVHHVLCDRSKTPLPSLKGSDSGVINETANKEIHKDAKRELNENVIVRKNSQTGSVGGISRTSSIAKSTSTSKTNTHVGPGPRFCSLRVQAGSKNILLDNAQPDVPPVLYKRHSKCAEDDVINFSDIVDAFDPLKAVPNEGPVVESTLVDVHVDSNENQANVNEVVPTINPILMNVNSSPLKPQKAHSFAANTNSIENNVPATDNINHGIATNSTTDLKFDTDKSDKIYANDVTAVDASSTANESDMKIFNFDHYEQTKLNYKRPIRKIDVSQLHSLESTKISKDVQPQTFEVASMKSKFSIPSKTSLPVISDVYPNLTQTQLKVNENKKIQTEQSTSSLSSDDSAALLHKQQLLRVAEWVEQNLEQQSLNDPLGIDEEMNYQRKITDSANAGNYFETSNALTMPHPVSKYSYKRDNNENVASEAFGLKIDKQTKQLEKNTDDKKMLAIEKEQSLTCDNIKTVDQKLKVCSLVKETIFPVEADDLPMSQTNHVNKIESKINNKLNNESLASDSRTQEELSAEELARMEYNVKKFLLSELNWAKYDSSRVRRTSSKTETDL